MAMVFSLRKFVRNTRLHADAMVRQLLKGSISVTSPNSSRNSRQQRRKISTSDDNR